ncbi:VC0807 family protein [Nonomuraea sp. NPDC049695]|uniref:VC0807 family protein n=1 Tax=Nonomuraea sp. NPDC049695 TaxID=3154734 RepID=UPI003423706A
MNAPGAAVGPEPPRKSRTADPRREVILNLGVNVVAPLAVFYGLRAAGVNQWLALTLAVLPPGIRAVLTVAVRRRIDALALFTLTILVLSVAASFLSGSARFLLAKDGWMTAVGGIWILATLPRTPFYFQAIRAFTGGATRDRAETAWRESPAFRHMLRVATAIWGVGLVLDAGVRFVLAYSLPIDKVPLISGLQYVVVFAALEVSSQVYLRRKGALVDMETEPEQETSK